ncbi:MAG: DivIVA domain-containing protein [Christensenellaceae bacterium]|jgi:cell division initiation protein|nr:DivIVA domain-containing protein [Christensenellaceae bacterium]
MASEQISAKDFPRKLRGYDEEAVTEYLRQLAAHIEGLAGENQALREQLQATAEQLAYMKNLEATLRETLMVAQRSAEETTRNANFRAEGIMGTANEQARRIIQRAQDEIGACQAQVEELKRQASLYRQNFRMLMSAQLQILEDSGIGQEHQGG